MAWLGRRCLALGGEDGGVELWTTAATEALRVRSLAAGGHHGHHDSVTSLTSLRVPQPARAPESCAVLPAAAPPTGAAGGGPDGMRQPAAVPRLTPPSRARRGRRLPPAEARPLLPDLPDLSRPDVEAAAHSLILRVAEALYPCGGAATDAGSAGGTTGPGAGPDDDEWLAAHLLHDLEAIRAVEGDDAWRQPGERGAEQHGRGELQGQAQSVPPELRFVEAVWSGDFGGALALAADTEGMMGADVVALAAAGGRAAWEAASRLYASHMEATGCAAEAALALAAVGDRAGAAGVYQRAGMAWEAEQVLAGAGEEAAAGSGAGTDGASRLASGI
ncbi:hypothetical protein GPECTOR_94g648 [Gonium pectorale]|uniref:Uncharacterized protein n=1 Tax=Gonium pectorale TaxID=33097 RepID=A0A150G0C5_GONPE|nr:hypothetical protein GPECTOR_94g648 [Gonium pectorale]|eukprot:KXZ43326.1 hypothetical protein GPECTOR_94g648 [Gonium pectorale]